MRIRTSQQSTAPRRLCVGVVPASEARRRRRLLAALESDLPIRFEGRSHGDWDGLDGVLAIGAGAAAALAAAPPGVPSLVARSAEREGGERQEVALADDPLLPRPLRRAALGDRHAGSLAVQPPAGATTLARTRAGVVWYALREPRQTVVAVAPAELGDGEALRERLAPGRCLALLALVQFLRELVGDIGWQPPALRAAFVLDDPNLHWPSYGHLRYRELLDHATRHRYHVAIAMVPLDGWLVHPGAARLFREGAAQLSICVHGNDHTGPELGRPRSDAEGAALAQQALRRARAFERRAGVPVSRVMVPPHERVSEPAARGLLACGYEAICTTRPYPWSVTREDVPWLTRPADAGPLAAWRPADVVAGGLPLLLRAGFGHAREDLALRAFLGQPLILYGHHEDVQGGLDVLADAAAAVNALGDVRWSSLAGIARGSAETRREGAVVALRPHARRVQVSLAAGVTGLRVDPAMLPLAPGERIELRADDAAPVVVDATGLVAVSGPAEVELRIVGARADAPRSRVPRGPRLWPVARRLVSEGRDRARAGRPERSALEGRPRPALGEAP